MKFLTQLLVVLALITAGISPACAFVSTGKAMMEICASDGSVKKVAIPEGFEDLLPADADTSSADNEQDHAKIMAALDDCAFCIFQLSGKAFSYDVVSVIAPDHAAHQPLVLSQSDRGNAVFHAFSPRAPPLYS